MYRYRLLGLPWGSVVKNPPANAGDADSIPGSGRSPEEGNGNPCQYSCLGNLMDRGTWWATVHGIAKETDTTWRLNNSGILFASKMLTEVLAKCCASLHSSG